MKLEKKVEQVGIFLYDYFIDELNRRQGVLKKYNLDKPSYIDTKNYLIVNISDLNIEKYRGHFSIADLRKLKDFIDENSN